MMTSQSLCVRNAIAVALELAAQLAVVVDLAVADQPDRAVGVAQRLLAAFEVDDRQAAMPERRALVVIDAFAVGAAMRAARPACARRALSRAGSALTMPAMPHMR